MASTLITDVSGGYGTGQITGLSYDWNSTTYIRAGIAETECVGGQSTMPSGDKGHTSAPSSGTNNYTNEWGLSGLITSGSKTYYGWVQTQSGTYWPTGSKTITIAPPPPVRPNSWYWTPFIVTGNSMTTYKTGSNYYAEVLDAVDWNDFRGRVNDFRIYKGLSDASFANVGAGQLFTGAMVQEVANAINAMSPSITALGASYGTRVTATILNSLQNSLNSIT